MPFFIVQMMNCCLLNRLRANAAKSWRLHVFRQRKYHPTPLYDFGVLTNVRTVV